MKKSTVNLLIDNGDLLLKKGKFKKAIEHYNKTLKKDPNNIKAWYKKGYALDELGKYQEAIESYNKVLKLDNNCIRAWNNKGNALDELGKYQEAIESYNKVLKIDSKDNDAFYNRGWSLSNLGLFEEAIESYNKALEIDPNDSDAWNYKGLIHFKMGQYQLAVDAYNTAIKIDPDNSDAWRNRENVLDELFWRNDNPIEKNFSPEYKIDISKVDKLIELGNKELKNKSYNKAQIFFKDALSLEPRNINAIIGNLKSILTLSNRAIRDKDYDLASKYFNEFSNIQSNLYKSKTFSNSKDNLFNNELKDIIDLNFDIAEKYLKDGKYKDAHKSFTEILYLINDDLDLVSNENRLLTLANTSIRNKEYENANKYFDKIINQNPDNPFALSGKLEIYIKLGNNFLKNSSYNKALNIFDSALETFDDIRIVYGKGLALAGIGDFEEAVKCFNKVLINSPGHLNALLYKSNALYNLKQFEEGYSCINKFLETDKRNIDACHLKIKLLIINQEYGKALNIINKALYYSNSVDLYYYKYIILKKQGNHTEAKKELDNAIKIEPDNEIFQQEMNNLSSNNKESV